MGKKLFRRRQVRNKPRRRRFVLNKLFWWFACFRPSEEDVDTKSVTKEEGSPTLTGSVIDGDQTKENHKASSADELQNSSVDLHQSSRHEESNNESERQDCVSNLISPAVHHLASICSMMGFSDVPIILPEDLEDVEDSFGMPVFLGAGNYGTVQLMRIKTTRRLCAVKSQHKHLNEQDAIKNFFREVRVLKSLQGIENVPEFCGLTVAMDDGAVPAIVQEYIGDNDSLHPTCLYDFIEKRNISEEQSLQLALQISRTVQDMHNRGWFHCDLKGDNVLLQFKETCDENQWDIFDIDHTPWEQCDGFAFTEISSSTDANIKLIDFGLSCHVDDRQEYRQYSEENQIKILETCKHVAPEVVKGQSVFTSSSDVYALGLLFNDMSRTLGDFLNLMGNQCMNINPERRPKISTVIKRIEFELLQTDL